MTDGNRFKAGRYVDEDQRDRRLARLVAVGETDVRIHLERINRCIDQSDGIGTYGALVDLFIATDAQHTALRTRSLYWARDILSPEHAATLTAAVAAGLSPATPIPPAVASMLGRGITDDEPLVRVARGPAASTSSSASGAARTRGAASGLTLPKRAAATARTSIPTVVPSEPPAATTDGAATDQFDPTRTLAGLVADRARVAPPEGCAWSVRSPGATVFVRTGLVIVDLHADAAAWAGRPVEQETEIGVVPSAEIDQSNARTAVDALWDLSVRDAAGRAPDQLAPDRRIALRRWPDLARVSRLPGDTMLAGRLQRGTTLDQLVEVADPAAARSFVTAAWLTGLLIDHDDAPSADAPETVAAPESQASGEAEAYRAAPADPPSARSNGSAEGVPFAATPPLDPPEPRQPVPLSSSTSPTVRGAAPAADGVATRRQRSAVLRELIAHVRRDRR